MKLKLLNIVKRVFLFSIFFSLFSTFGQQATLASGGNAIGAGGKVSYSIGQVANETQVGTTGTITQGVQQPFEIVTLSGEEFTSITLEAVVYPNPTNSIINLSIKNYSIENLKYQIYDIQGRKIVEGKIASDQTTIDMESYPTAIYILKVNSNSKELKTFKIIKK
ncbi:T9SS type A sorting domain-containing protein [Flavobacterium sp. SUN052]|uniref:T9SS type A sorting domain-containing protein n=1 Tax=Flavobacterium sp. SUN052 TaxID=3002441 RepID=UPI00237DFD93|nr:T9SS type A sorting domain-containing protein [Flavobacterium sp. SUN052]MEC4004015.1 T9SS type A sorting domain-containing protein [Flavobacterium sp. SUN052]